MSSGNFQKAFLNNFTIFITLKGNKIILHHSGALGLLFGLSVIFIISYCEQKIAP